MQYILKFVHTVSKDVNGNHECGKAEKWKGLWFFAVEHLCDYNYIRICMLQKIGILMAIAGSKYGKVKFPKHLVITVNFSNSSVCQRNLVNTCTTYIMT